MKRLPILSITCLCAIALSGHAGNLIVNSGFGSGMTSWETYVHPQASATMSVVSGEMKASISNGGAEIWYVHIRQNGIPIVQGKEYVIRFDARAEQSRMIHAMMEKNGSPYTSYSGFREFNITTTMTTYERTFIMSEPTDNAASICFEFGDQALDVFIDNVVFMEKPDDVSYLSDMDWESATIGWGTIHRDASVQGNPIKLNNVTYSKGIGTHAISTIIYNLGGMYSRFISDVGVDDEKTTTATIVFKVYKDGAEVYNSGTMTPTTTTKTVDISVEDCNELKLVVGDCGNGITNDHADWAGARVIPAVQTVDMWREAESATYTGFSRLSDTAASNDYCLLSVNNSPTVPGIDRVAFNFTIQTAGIYHFFARVNTGGSGSDDSYWFQVDGETWYKWNDLNALGTGWNWAEFHNSDGGDSIVSYNLSTGDHTLIIANRENGAKIDKIFITSGENNAPPPGAGGQDSCTLHLVFDYGGTIYIESDNGFYNGYAGIYGEHIDLKFPSGLMLKLYTDPGYNWKFSHWVIDSSTSVDTDTLLCMMSGTDVGMSIMPVFSLAYTLSVTVPEHAVITVNPLPDGSSKTYDTDDYSTTIELKYDPLPGGYSITVAVDTVDQWYEFTYWENDSFPLPSKQVALTGTLFFQELNPVIGLREFKLWSTIPPHGSIKLVGPNFEETTYDLHNGYEFSNYYQAPHVPWDDTIYDTTCITLIAFPDSGYTLTSWNDPLNTTNDTFTVAMTGDVLLCPVFERIKMDFKLPYLCDRGENLKVEGRARFAALSEENNGIVSYDSLVLLDESDVPGCMVSGEGLTFNGATKTDRYGALFTGAVSTQSVWAESCTVNDTLRTEYVSAKKVRVATDVFPDYVFDKSHTTLTLPEVEAFIHTNNKLPGMPSEREVAEQGIQLDKLYIKLLEKVEEMSLYLIGLDHKIKSLNSPTVVKNRKGRN